MSSLENIVRPFQTSDVSPPQRYINAGVAGVPNVRIQIGRNGAGKTMNGSFACNWSIYQESDVEETSQNQ